MKLQDGNMVIEVGAGARKEALEYGIARFREREKTKRTLMLVVTVLAIASGVQVVFAPQGREISSRIMGGVLLVLSLGAIGTAKFTLKTPGCQITAKDGE